MFKDCLFSAVTKDGEAQPISVMPALFVDQFNGVRVQFGTGGYFHPLDRLDTTTQSFYGLIDNNSGVEITRDDLADQTKLSDMEDMDGKRGFVFDLPRVGERVVTEAVYFDGITFFTSFVPDMDVCASGGDSYLYFINYYNGAPFERPIIDMNGDQTINEEDYIEDTRSVRNGEYSGLASTPILSPGTNEIIIQSSDTRIRSRLFDFDIMDVISWREVLQ